MSDSPNSTPPVLSAQHFPESVVTSADTAPLTPSLSSTFASSAVSRIAVALDKLNSYRAQVGVAPTQIHPALKASAEAHAAYYTQNAPLSGSIHNEIEGKPGFTGKDFFARTAHAAYLNSQSTNEDMDTSADPVAVIDRLMATLNHRIPLLDPAYPDIGFGAAAKADGSNPVTVIDFGMPVWKTSFQPAFFFWPPENGTNFAPSYRGEGPDLFRQAGLNPAYPIGNPITLTYRGPGTIKYLADGMSLTDTNGQAINCYKLADLNFFWTARNTAAIASVQPLAANTSYVVSFSYSVNNGPAQTRTWRFSTGSSGGGSSPGTGSPGNPAKTGAGSGSNTGSGGGAGPGPSTGTSGAAVLSPGLLHADPAVRSQWQEADGPVKAGKVGRSWLYGPDIFDSRTEDYQEAPTGQRVVYYFDKARLEITNPAGNRASQWYVSSGLLVRELISGAIQTGDNRSETRSPASVPIAGESTALANPDAPTYASFQSLASLNRDRRAVDRTGQALNTLLNKDGTTAVLATPPAAVAIASYEPTQGHNLAEVFMRWLSRLPGGWLYLMGLPLTEPYWMRVKVAGAELILLAQLFERRTITFTPSNAPQWQVELGNIGRHYHAWRYGV